MSITNSMVKYITGKMARQRGENAEQHCARIFKAAGWVVGRIRQGPIDVVAANEGQVVLVQVKSGRARVKKVELEAMINWGKQFNAAVEVWHFRRGGTIEKRCVKAQIRLRG